MKTEIEFRIWSYKLKEMLYQTTPVHSNEETGQVVFSFPKINFGPFEFLQYIGVRDPLGIKIYVGDIIESANGRGVVKFKEGHFYYDLAKPVDPMLRISGAIYWDKVIGDIYQNPELLK